MRALEQLNCAFCGDVQRIGRTLAAWRAAFDQRFDTIKAVWNFFEDLGYFERRHDLRLAEIDSIFGNLAVKSFRLSEPFLDGWEKEMRRELGHDPELYAEYRRLVRRLEERARKKELL